MIGTPGYTPSEQARGKPKLCSDIYAVGMIGIQALTGVSPEELPEDASTGNIVWQNLVSVNPQLANVLDKMVCERFSQRYQNAAEALQAVALLSPSPPSPSQAPTIVVAPTQSSLNSSAQQQPTVNISTFTFTIITVNIVGKAINRQQGQAQFFQENIGQDASLEMVSIPGGSFMRGSPPREGGRNEKEEPQESVTVPPFFLGKYPITQAQWQAVMGNNPSNFKGNNRPVECISWNEATEFCQKLSQITGRNYRLPSEAEWEYACRAGTTTPFHFGTTISSDLANYNGKNTYQSEPKGIYREQTTDVGSFPANAFGLYDMHGNIFEWCQDIWHENYNVAPIDGNPWETGGDSKYRVLRGGSWTSFSFQCRSAARSYNDADKNHFSTGFRVVCTVEGAQ